MFKTTVAILALLAMTAGVSHATTTKPASERLAAFNTCMEAVPFNGATLVPGTHFESRLKPDGTGYQARIRDSLRSDAATMTAVNKCAEDNGHSKFS